MKKLGKLIIDPKKIIRNEELIALRGGYGDGGFNYSWLCFSSPGCWCGCTSTIYNDPYLACLYCEVTCGSTNVLMEGPYPYNSACS